jgi:hypothetical protein
MMVSAASGVNAELLAARGFFKDRSLAESELLAELITQ